MNLGGILLLGIGMVFLAVGFIMYPIILTACDTILAFTKTVSGVTTNTGNFTGLSSMVGITPLLALLGYVSVAVLSGFMGVKVMKSGENIHGNIGSFLLLGIGLVFFAIGLIIYPVVLEGLATTFANGGGGIPATYTGLGSILKMVPMLLLIAYVSATVLSGYFGIKSLSSSD
jgi:hypothetical protein